jgi:hypothetical protein
MNLKASHLCLLSVFIFLNTSNTFSQEWNWRWAESISNHDDFTWMVVQNCDILNNVYTVAPYDSVLFLPDTTLFHSEPGWFQSNKNNAVLKYNDRGEFVKALDLFTLPNGQIFTTYVGTDNDLNVYISCSFMMRLYIQDTIIEPCFWPAWTVEGIVIKLTPDYELVWTKLICGHSLDRIDDYFVNAYGDSYLLCYHDGLTGNQIIFFEQDTIYPNGEFNSLSKLDKDGMMLWRKDFYGNISAYRITQGEDGLIYFWGVAYSDIILDNDTIFHPYAKELIPASFYAAVNEDGTVEQLSFVDYGVFAHYMVVNSLGERYISTSIIDTIIINQDTIIVPEDEQYGFIGKYNAQLEPEWYHIIPTDENQSLGYMQMALDGDNLIFSITSNDDLYIADTVIPINTGNEVFVGEFNSLGELLNIDYTISSELSATGLVLDNCNNPIISGAFKGFTYFGPDTLASYDLSEFDGFITKLQRNEPLAFDIGRDSSFCNEHTLYGPLGYIYYSWNDTISNQNSYTTTGTGTITFACANEEGCWLYDTINVTIHPGFEIDLGPDTTIFENQSITFTIPCQYQSYLWSNTVTANATTVFGESYDPGTIVQVWVQVIDGPCIVSDTVYVTIKSELAVGDYPESNLFLYPNPSSDFVYIQTSSEIEHIEICDLHGSTLSIVQINNSPGEVCRISLSNLNQGVYIMKIFYTGSEIIKKIIKL